MTKQPFFPQINQGTLDQGAGFGRQSPGLSLWWIRICCKQRPVLDNPAGIFVQTSSGSRGE
jgi:hypothetical protein